MLDLFGFKRRARERARHAAEDRQADRALRMTGHARRHRPEADGPFSGPGGIYAGFGGASDLNADGVPDAYQGGAAGAMLGDDRDRHSGHQHDSTVSDDRGSHHHTHDSGSSQDSGSSGSYDSGHSGGSSYDSGSSSSYDSGSSGGW